MLRIDVMSVSMTLSDPNPGFKVTVSSRVSEKRRVLGTKLVYHTNKKPYPTYYRV